MSAMTDAIAAHRAAWQAFQDAGVEDDQAGYEKAIEAQDDEHDAIDVLLATIPTSGEDIAALRAHLNWYVVTEHQRRDTTPQMFALHAIIQRTEIDVAVLLMPIRTRAKALMEAVDADNKGAMVFLERGNGRLISRDTIKAADELRKALAVQP